MNQLIKKERFDKIYNEIEAAGVPYASQVHPEESKIRIELPLKNGQSQYIFDIKNAQVTGPREVNLDRNDVFIPNSWGVLLGLRSTTNPQIEKLFAFVPVNDGVNPSVFPVAFQSDAAETIYAGFMQWIVDNAVMISSYPTERFKHIPETQGAFVLDSNDAAIQEGIQPEWDLDKNLALLIERIMIAGTRDHKISLNFDASGLTFPVTAGYTPYLVLMMDGFLVKGGCQYIDNINPWSTVVGKW